MSKPKGLTVSKKNLEIVKIYLAKKNGNANTQPNSKTIKDGGGKS